MFTGGFVSRWNSDVSRWSHQPFRLVSTAGMNIEGTERNNREGKLHGRKWFSHMQNLVCVFSLILSLRIYFSFKEKEKKLS